MPENVNLLRALGGVFFIFWTAFNTTLVDVVGSEQQIPLSVVKLWASAFGGEIKSIAAKYSGSQLLQKELPGPFESIKEFYNNLQSYIKPRHPFS